MIVSFSFFPKKFWILPIAFNWLFAFQQIFATCFSKLNLLSISIPKSVTDFSDEKKSHLFLNHTYSLFYQSSKSLLGICQYLQSCYLFQTNQLLIYFPFLILLYISCSCCIYRVIICKICKFNFIYKQKEVIYKNIK